MKQKKTKEQKEKRYTKMRMTRERKSMRKKSVGLIVERTFRDSSQPPFYPPKTPSFATFHQSESPKPTKYRPVHFSESLTNNKFMNRSYFRSGLSFDETRRDEDETMTVKKSTGENHV